MKAEYEGHLIEVRSYRSTGGKWRPDVRVSLHDANTLHTSHFVAPPSIFFETEDACNAGGAWAAADWIDRFA